jgi:adenylyltransferase/sulfurtransferase
VIGSLQANEAIKYLLGIGDPLSGILLVYDALETRFRGLQIERNPERKKITELSDVEAFCANSSTLPASEQVEGPSESASDTMFHDISPSDAAKRMTEGWQPFILDVRTENEATIANIESASILIPHDTVDKNLDQLPAEGDILVYCHHGGRSMMAVMMLASAGVDSTRLYNLAGGIDAWSIEVDDSVPRY